MFNVNLFKEFSQKCFLPPLQLQSTIFISFLSLGKHSLLILEEYFILSDCIYICNTNKENPSLLSYRRLLLTCNKISTLVVIVSALLETVTSIWSPSPFGSLIWLIWWVGLLYGSDCIRLLFLFLYWGWERLFKVSVQSFCHPSLWISHIFSPDLFELLHPIFRTYVVLFK